MQFTLKSDGAFGRGDGVAGLVNQEVQHDEYGCPYLGGKALKGILVNECADILAALPAAQGDKWGKVASALFGEPGSNHKNHGRIYIGDATLPPLLRQAIQIDVDAGGRTATADNILQSLTTIRYQTAINEKSGAADKATLRSMRVVIRQTTFVAPIWLAEPMRAAPESATDETVAQHAPTVEETLMLLSACLKALRRVGTYRNRGLGRLEQVQLHNGAGELISERYFQQFCEEVCR
jgi:hypothetical protein